MCFEMRRNFNAIMNYVKRFIGRTVVAGTGPNKYYIGSGPLTVENTVGIPPASDRPYVDMYTYRDSVFASFACVPPEFARSVRNLPPCDKFMTDYFYRPRPEKMKDKNTTTNDVYSMSLMIASGSVIGGPVGSISNSDIPDNVFTIPTLRAALTAAYNHKIPIRIIRKRCGEWKNDYPVSVRYEPSDTNVKMNSM